MVKTIKSKKKRDSITIIFLKLLGYQLSHQHNCRAKTSGRVKPKTHNVVVLTFRLKRNNSNLSIKKQKDERQGRS